MELSFKLELTIRLVKVMFLDENSLKNNFEEMKLLRIPSMHTCLPMTESFYTTKYRPNDDQIVVHDINIDKFEVAKKADFLVSQPFEKPI